MSLVNIDIPGIISHYIYIFLDVLFFQPIHQLFKYITSALYIPMPSFGSPSEIFIDVLFLLLIFYIIYRLSALIIRSSVVGAVLTLSTVFLNAHFNFGWNLDYISLLRIFFVGFFGYIFYKIAGFLRASFRQIDKPVLYIYELVKMRIKEDLNTLSQKYEQLKTGKKPQKKVCLTNAEIMSICKRKYSKNKQRPKNKLQDLGVRRIDEI